MLKVIWNFCYTVVYRFFEEGCLYRAAALAYTSLLSIVPLMVVSFSVLFAFPVFKEFGQKIQNIVFANFVATSAQTVQHHIQSFVQQASKLPATSMVFLLIMAILLVYAMEKAFNAIWHVKRNRHGVQAFLLYWAVITLTPVLMGLGIAVSSYLATLPFLSGAARILVVNKAVLICMPYLMTFVAFTLLYIAVPNCKVKIRFAVIGALIATIFFEIAKGWFTFYIAHFPTYRLLYGALATIPLFLIWIYISWMIILFGVMVTHELTKTRSKR